jgi:ATP-dependent Zn protease
MKPRIYPPQAPLPDGSMIDMEFIPRGNSRRRNITTDDIFNRLADMAGDKVDEELKETMDFIFRC